MEEEIVKLIDSNKCKLLGEGFVSKSYELEINSKKYIVLQGQIEDSYYCYLRAYNSLIFLFNNNKPLIKTLKIPFENIRLIRPNSNFNCLKYGALLYTEIDGIVFYEKYFEKINIENLTNSISKFLIELYNIPINKNEINEYRNKLIKQFNSDTLVLKQNLKGDILDKINAFEKVYLDYMNNFDDFHYMHGDLWEENMIISENYQELIGIVDFDNFGIADIAKDYASLLDFGFDFINILIDKTKDIIKDREEFIKRIKINQTLIEYEDVAYILRDSKLEHRLSSKLKMLKGLLENY